MRVEKKTKHLHIESIVTSHNSALNTSDVGSVVRVPHKFFIYHHILFRETIVYHEQNGFEIFQCE